MDLPTRESAWLLAAARQRANGLAEVVGGFDGDFGRLWTTDASILNDDRRVPIIWITTVLGLKVDCCNALCTDYDDYFPALEVDCRYMRDASLCLFLIMSS